MLAALDGVFPSGAIYRPDHHPFAQGGDRKGLGAGHQYIALTRSRSNRKTPRFGWGRGAECSPALRSDPDGWSGRPPPQPSRARNQIRNERLVSHLFVNAFQPSLKLADKLRGGVHSCKCCDAKEIPWVPGCWLRRRSPRRDHGPSRRPARHAGLTRVSGSGGNDTWASNIS